MGILCFHNLTHTHAHAHTHTDGHKHTHGHPRHVTVQGSPGLSLACRLSYIQRDRGHIECTCVAPRASWMVIGRKRGCEWVSKCNISHINVCVCELVVSSLCVCVCGDRVSSALSCDWLLHIGRFGPRSTPVLSHTNTHPQQRHAGTVACLNCVCGVCQDQICQGF